MLAFVPWDFKEQTIPVSAAIKDAIDIFYTVNSQGIRLTQAELALAQISGYWADARKVLKAKQYEMKDNGINLSLDFFVYCLSFFMQSSLYYFI